MDVSLRERIRLNLIYYLEKANMNQVQLAEKLEISKGTVNNWTKGNNSPDVDTVPKICKALGIPIIALYEERPWQTNASISKDPPNSYPVDPNHVAPVIGSVAAGPGLVPIEEIDGYYVLPPQLKNAEEYRYFRVKGNSMEPEISDGQMVLVHIQPDVENGEIAVVIVNGEEGVVKRVQKEKDCLVLLSSNPTYPPRVVMGQELRQTIIWGKVAYAWREF